MSLCEFSCLFQLVLFLVVERVRNLLASIEWAYEDEQCSASHYEAKGAGGCVAFVICSQYHSVGGM